MPTGGLLAWSKQSEKTSTIFKYIVMQLSIIEEREQDTDNRKHEERNNEKRK
jgi:hypothetical protein